MRIIGILFLIALIHAAACCAESPVPLVGEVHGDQCNDPEFDKLAATVPSWAPLPIFRESTQLLPFLTEVMQSPDADSRARAAFMLGQVGRKESAKILAKGLADKSRIVRIHCGIALACLGDQRGVPTCAAALTNEPEWVRVYAAYGLWCVNSTDTKRALKKSAHGQPILAAKAIQGALNSPPINPPRIKAFARANSQTPDDVIELVADSYIRESEWWWHKGDYEQGIRCLEALVFIDPGDVQSFSLIAWLHKNLGRPAKAEASLKRAIAANPENPDAYSELGQHYMNAKDYAHAEEPLRKSVELGGDHLARRQYAHCLENLGKLRESLEQWAEILRIMPEDAAARLNYDRIEKLLTDG